MIKLCSICKKETESESSSILAIGGYGNPKYICDECSKELDTVIKGHEYDEIISNMSLLTDKITASGIDDEQVLKTVENIFIDSKSRAELIKMGEYDFAKDELDATDVETDIPEELRETEEDRILDEQEKAEEEKRMRAAAKFDKFFFYPFLGAMLVGAIAYIIITRFL